MGFRFDLILKYLAFLLEGLKYTLLVSISAFVLALLIGLIVAILRLSRIRVLDAILSLYVDIFRSIPQLVVLFWFYYAIPLLFGRHVSAVVSAIIALTLLSSAGMSEIFRSGILSIDIGQWEAAFALGMTKIQAYRRIILPQAVVRMLPPFVNSSIAMVKVSALVSAVGVYDLMWQGNALNVHTLRRTEVYTVVAVIYFGLTYPQSLFINYLHKKYIPVE